MSDILNIFHTAVKQEIENGFVIAELTDEFIVDKWPKNINFDKAMTVRVFSKEVEILLSRSDIGRDFSCRVISDDYIRCNEKKTENSLEYYDELQYLDIDDSIERDNGKVTATGGGRYNLPMDKFKNARVRIRYYIDKYKETRQARICDWRVVEFVEEKKDGEK